MLNLRKKWNELSEEDKEAVKKHLRKTVVKIGTGVIVTVTVSLISNAILSGINGSDDEEIEEDLNEQELE